MFLNKNNKLINEFQKGGEEPMNPNPVVNPEPMNPNPVVNTEPMNPNPGPNPEPMNPNPELNPGAISQDANMFSGNESYPNEDYLYDKITSQETQNNIKIYICAFTINKELDTHFVKYIVQQKDSVVSLPFFEFTSAQNEMPQQSMGQPMFGENEV